MIWALDDDGLRYQLTFVMIDVASTLVAAGLAIAAQAGADECETIPGVSGLLDASSGKVLLLGGQHGADLGPTFTDSIVCESLSASETVALALQIPVSEQSHLDTYLKSDGLPEDRYALFDTSPFWSQNIDGRSSAAMFDLLESARVRMRGGAALSVKAVAYDAGVHGALPDVANPQAFSMAGALAELNQEADRVVILADSLLASRTTVENLGDTPVETIGSYSDDGSVYSVKLLYWPGRVWSCQEQDGFEECGERRTGVRLIDGDPRVLDLETIQETPYWEFYRAGFDGFVLLGSPTGSQPARIRSAAIGGSEP